MRVQAITEDSDTKFIDDYIMQIMPCSIPMVAVYRDEGGIWRLPVICLALRQREGSDENGNIEIFSDVVPMIHDSDSETIESADNSFLLGYEFGLVKEIPQIDWSEETTPMERHKREREGHES
jgi:hypothetical protein